MPEMNKNNDLTLDIIHRIEQALPLFDLNCTIIFDSVDEDLRCYFETYGFDKFITPNRYSLGFLDFTDYRVAAHYWRLPASSGTVFVAHGLFDHVGLYLDLVDFLLASGFDVIAIDFPGHGLSEGEPAVIQDFSEYALVLQETLEALKRKIISPFFAVGQSTGCAAILNYVLAARGEEFVKLVLLAPLIQPRGWGFVSMAYVALSRFIRFVKRRFAVNTHRLEFNEFLSTCDPLQSRYISVEWVGAMKKWIHAFDHYDDSVIETLIVQGDADETVDWRKNVPRIRTKFQNSRVEIINGAMHHLVKEGDTWREPVFNNIREFLMNAGGHTIGPSTKRDNE